MPYLQERPQADRNRRFAGLLKFDRQLVSMGNQFTLDPAKFAKWFSQWSDFFALNHSKPSIKPCSRIMEIVK
jgi:DICT domain-containing protein